MESLLGAVPVRLYWQRGVRIWREWVLRQEEAAAFGSVGQQSNADAVIVLIRRKLGAFCALHKMTFRSSSELVALCLAV
jgi:hypothetical protein